MPEGAQQGAGVRGVPAVRAGGEAAQETEIQQDENEPGDPPRQLTHCRSPGRLHQSQQWQNLQVHHERHWQKPTGDRKYQR